MDAQLNAESCLKKGRILFLQYTDPCAYPPLEHASRILADAGWKVLFLGTNVVPPLGITFPEHERIEVRKFGRFAPGILGKMLYLIFALRCILQVQQFQPDWLYVSDLTATPIARLLARLLKFKVLYHEHDSPEYSKKNYLLRCRTQIGYHAELCVLPNQERARAFREQTGRSGSIACVWNCPRRSEAEKETSSESDRRLWLHYHGNISEHRLPWCLLEALRLMPKHVGLRAIGYETAGNHGYMERFSREAGRLGLDKRLEHRPAMPREELFRWARKGFVGIALMPTQSTDINVRNMTGASNKPFDYLACGLALLVTDLSDWNEFFVKPGYGLACNPSDPESIAKTISWFVAHPNETRAMGEAGRQRILSEWNYEQQFAPILSSLGNQK